jgi:hypothetical protein
MATFEKLQHVKRKTDTVHMRVQGSTTGPDGVEMVTCSWLDMWQHDQSGTFRADELESIPDPSRLGDLRRRRRR